MLQQIIPHFLRIGFWLITFVHRDNRWASSGLGMIDGFNRLHHDRIIRRHNQHHNIRDIGPA